MYFLFTDIYETRREYQTKLTTIIKIINQFKPDAKTQVHFDSIRNEFFITSKHYTIVCEVEKIATNITLNFTTQSKLRLNMPKTYTHGFIGYIENNLDLK